MQTQRQWSQLPGPGSSSGGGREGFLWRQHLSGFKDKQELSKKGVGKIPGLCKDRWQEASWHREGVMELRQ